MYAVVIRRNSDGLTRVCPQQHDWDGADGDWFWWSEGNMSCDCNRALEFARAGGEPEPEVMCGDVLFDVLRFELPNGEVITGPDA